MNSFKFYKNKIFSKVFILVFLSFLILLGIISYQSIFIQKKSILNSYDIKAKSIGDLIKFASTDAMIIDDEIKILEFIYDFVQASESISTVLVSRKNGNTLIINKKKWELKNKFNYVNDNNLKKISKIEYSNYINKNVYKYKYPIYFSGVLWGWFDLELYLDEYYEKLNNAYKQVFFLGLAFLAASLFISLFIARMVSKPIIQLQNVTKEIANGNLNKRADVKSEDEIGYLASSFNKMVISLQYSQDKLRKSHTELENRVQERTKELKVLNETLEQRVKNEISKQKEQEQILIQQSKLAAMGEMIGNIAHQWRQPLNALGLVVQNIRFTYQMDELDDEFMDNSINKVNLLTKNMSKTIDDFRNFFKPNKEKTHFHLDIVVKNSINLILSAFEHNNVKINYNDFEKIEVFGFPNEFSQTILNILNNAKDALIENEVDNAHVDIKIFSDEKYGYVKIKDNAGGIPECIIEKIFNPYFTTKEEGKGTGIGLYMSKIIIEQNMNGKLRVENIDGGAEFTAQIPIYKE